MKVSVQPEWSLFNGIMKTSGLNKRIENHIEENEKDNPNTNLTGDAFYDYIGKFCNLDQ